MKFFICIALVAFLLGLVSADDQVFVPLKQGLRSNPAKMLEAFNSGKTTNLRAKAISGSVPGNYVAVDIHDPKHCMGEVDSARIYKAGHCVPAYGDNGAVIGHNKASCFTDTGMSEVIFYDASDSTCSGPPIQNGVLDMMDNTCYNGVAAQCVSDLHFAKKAYAKQLFQFIYTNQEAYDNSRLNEAVYFEMIPDMSSTVMNIADEDRAECAYLLPSYPPQCQDTRSFKSIAFVGRDFSNGVMTMYTMYGGRGDSRSWDFTSPNKQMGDGNWMAYGYLKDNWYETYVATP